jgi:hypothetical protein
MKYAPIVPPFKEGEKTLDASGIGYHMVLGQHLLDDPRYRYMYKWRARKGDFIMVDNGAAEGLEPNYENFRKIVDAANHIGADEIVMPDAYMKKDETLALLSNWSTLNLVEPRRRIVIPQGDSMEEWQECVTAIMRMDFPFATLGIPKHLERFKNGRREALRFVMGNSWHRTHNIHLFGVWKNVEDEVMLARTVYDRIRGIDSGCAVAYAQAKKHMTCGEHASLDWLQPFNVDEALRNINEVLDYCNN